MSVNSVSFNFQNFILRPTECSDNRLAITGLVILNLFFNICTLFVFWGYFASTARQITINEYPIAARVDQVFQDVIGEQQAQEEPQELVEEVLFVDLSSQPDVQEDPVVEEGSSIVGSDEEFHDPINEDTPLENQGSLPDIQEEQVAQQKHQEVSVGQSFLSTQATSRYLIIQPNHFTFEGFSDKMVQRVIKDFSGKYPENFTFCGVHKDDLGPGWKAYFKGPNSGTDDSPIIGKIIKMPIVMEEILVETPGSAEAAGPAETSESTEPYEPTPVNSSGFINKSESPEASESIDPIVVEEPVSVPPGLQKLQSLLMLPSDLSQLFLLRK